MPDPLYVEATPLLYPELTGVGRLVARAIEALGERTSLRLFTAIEGDLVPKTYQSEIFPPGHEIVLAQGSLPPGADADLSAWARSLLKGRPRRLDRDVSPRCAAFYGWLRPEQRHFRREVCFLHDFTISIQPWAHQRGTRRHFGRFYGQTIALCDAAIANSDSTRADASWLCALPNDRIVVSRPGPTLCVREHARRGQVGRRERQVLVVSTVEPRKNVQFTIDWFMNTELLGPGWELRWIGPQGWGDGLPAVGSRLEARGRTVVLEGLVTDRRLCEAYREATFTLYPSLYEGFGFPVLESLLHGTPVMTSFHSSLQEFIGPGVFFFDPYDRGSVDLACQEMKAARPEPIQREDLLERCSWGSLAKTVLQLAN
jgi:glycosyltransferase involved in cell wall biosynthesis